VQQISAELKTIAFAQQVTVRVSAMPPRTLNTRFKCVSISIEIGVMVWRSYRSLASHHECRFVDTTDSRSRNSRSNATTAARLGN
jgi:hypothetical protein